MIRKKRLLLIAPFALTAMTLFVAVGGWLVMSLWNWLTPPIFGFRMITFWQALGLLALCRILFGGFRTHGGRPRYDFRKRMAERWDKMTPEERERFRQSWRGRGYQPPDTTPSA